MKKGIVCGLSFLLLFALLASACTSTTPADTTSKTTLAITAAVTEGSQEITMRFLWWGGQARHERTLNAMELYTQKNPNIKLEGEYLGLDQYWENLATHIAGGTTPDIVQQDYRYIKQYAENDLLLNLDPYIGKELDLSDCSDSAIAGGIINGSLYGVSVGSNAYSIAYNPRILSQVGISNIDPDWKYEDYEKLCLKIHNELGIYGGMMDKEYIYSFIIELRSKGYTLYSEDGKGLGYADDSIAADFLKQRYELTKAGVYPEPDIVKQQQSDYDSLMATEKVGFYHVWSNGIVSISKAAGFDFEIAPFYGPNAVEGRYIKPSQFFTASKTTKYPAEAVKFINYLTNDVDANAILLADRGVPIASKVRQGIYDLVAPAAQKTFDLLDYLGNNSSPIDPPDPEGAGEVVRAFDDCVEMMLYDKLTPDQAAKEFRNMATAILSKN